MRKGFLPLIIMLCVCIVGFFGCQQKNDAEKVELTVYSTNIELYENDTHQIKYDYTGKNSVQFTSNDDSVVTVNSKGLVTAVGVGTAFIDVNAGDINKLISIKVVDQQISVALDKENISVAKNSEQYITANVLVGSDLISSGIEWTVSSNDLTLTSNGCVAKIKSAKTGYYSITATYKSVSATCSVKIVENSAVKLETPVITVSNCDTITWNAVANAESYQIKVNDGNWIDVDGSSYSIKDVSDVLKKGDSAEVYVKAVAKDNFSVIDSNHRHVEVSHNFTETAVTSYDCVNEGTVKFTCEDCGREYVQEKYSKGHNFIDGVCLDCDALQVPGITYEYHEETNSYWVKSATGSVTPEVTFVAGTYDDGTHGKLPVTHIGQNAFKGNTIIEKVYLPMNVTTIYPGAFESCTNLYFISMTGVKEIDGFNSKANHFLGDFKLRIAIVSAGFTLKTQVFNDYYAPNYVPILDFYVTSSGSITAKHSSQNSMISDVIYYYDGTGTACNSWKYGKDGDVVVNYSHSYGRVDERFECVKCGEFYDEVFEYEYDENTNSYGVKGFKGEGREEVVGILTEYNDGVHGILPVTKVGRSAFSGNTSLTRAILPETITQLTDNTFAGCMNLVYVAMPGVVHNEYAVTGGNHFINCTKLKTVVLGESFYTNCQMFFANPGPADSTVTDIYLSSKDGKFVAEGNQDLLTGNIYYYDETGESCGTWHYNENRTDVILNTEHNYKNGVCSKCGAFDPVDYTYMYDVESNSYIVSKYFGNEKTSIVKGEFNDGMHGVLPVSTIGKGAFKANTTIEKIILPNSVATLLGSAFRGCTSLKYVDASGVTKSEYGNGNDFIFAGCTALTTVIFGDSFDMSGNARVFDIDAEEGTVENPILNIYLTSIDGVFKSNSYPQRLLSGKVYHYEESGNSCGTWKYNSDKTSVILNEKQHNFVSGKCTNCGMYDGNGMEYLYNAETDTYTASKYNGSATEVVVYAMFDDGINGEKPVTALGKSAFLSNKTVTKVVLPESITNVNNNAFSGCTALEKVIMSGVTRNIYSETGGNQFYNCTSLKVVVLGAAFTTNCQYFIYDANMATTENKKILDIYLLSADGTFTYDGNQDLWSGNIYYYDESGTKCGQWSFNEDNTDVVLNTNEHEYEDGKCVNCGTYDGNGVEYIYDTESDSYFVSKYMGADKEVIILSKFDDGVNGEKIVTAVGKRAFGENKDITKVVLPESIKDIYNAAFTGCTSLKTVIMPGVTENIYAKTDCNQFYNCTALETVVLGESFYTNVQFFIYVEDALNPNAKILNLYLSSSNGSFKYDGSNQDLWSGKLFYYDGSGKTCSSWKYNDDKTDVIVNTFVHEFVDGACKNCDFDQTVGISYIYDESLGGYVVDSGVQLSQYVRETAYKGTDKEVYIRATYNDGTNGEHPVVGIYKQAFKDNKFITKVIAPKSVTELYGAAFSGCSKLEYVDLSGVTVCNYTPYAENQFANCTSLKTLILGESFDFSGNATVFNASTAPKIPILDIYLSSSNGTFKIATAYSQNLLSGKVYHYNESGVCGTWKYNDSKADVILTLHSYKDGACTNCGADQTVGISYVYDAELDGYVVAKLEGDEFVNAYTGMDKEIYVRATYNDGTNGVKPVVAVGNRAFRNNTSIEKVILPASVTLITNGAFSGCTSLTYVDAHGWETSTYNAKILGKNVACDNIFSGCNALEIMILGKSFDMSGNAWVFDSSTAPSPAKLDIFLSSSDGTFKSNTYEQRLLSGKIYHYNENDICGTWTYVQGEDKILVREQHTPDADTCKYCASRNYVVTAWGDSITHGDGTSDASKRYSNLLSEMLPIDGDVINQGLGGRKLIDEGVVDSIIADTSEVLIIALGTNDYCGGGGKLGSITDTTADSYYGALNVLKNALDEKDVRVVFMTPLGVRSGNVSQYGGTVADFGQAVKDVLGDDTTGKYTIIDGLEIVSVSDIEKYSKDGVHVNDDAHVMIANAMFNAMKDIFGVSMRG